MAKAITYKRGTRRDIIYLLHGTGILTYRAIRILPAPYNKRTIQQKISEMLAENVIGKAKPKGKTIRESFFYMKDYEINSEETLAGIPKECAEFYKDYWKNQIRKIWSLKDATPPRKILEAELLAMMYASGINTMPDQNGSGAKYFGSREVKRYTEYRDEVTSLDGERKVQYSKVYGLLVSSGGNYAVYHTYKSGLSKLSSGEYKIIHQLGRIVRQLKRSEETVTSALVVVDNLEALIPNVDINDLNSKYALNYYNFTNAFTQIYAVPYSEYGRDMIELMTRPEWKHQIIEAACGEVQDTSVMSFVCDHYDKESGVGTLVFCSPDIIRLKKFLDAARLKGERDKFHVICFDTQKEFVAKVIGRYAIIYTTPFKKYYEKER